MISFEVKKNKEYTELHIIGEAVIEHAREIFLKIKEIYNQKANLIITTQGVEVADISFLQIIISAFHTFSKNNLVFELNKKSSSSVKRLLFDSGYIDLKTSDLLNEKTETFDSFTGNNRE